MEKEELQRGRRREIQSRRRCLMDFGGLAFVSVRTERVYFMVGFSG